MSKISWKSTLLLGVIGATLVLFGAAYPISDNIQEQERATWKMMQEEGEESGKKLSPTETYDQVHKGVRLVLAFHNASSSFLGSVENVTDKTIKAVRVEVHLSNETELGPTEPMDLAPGEKAGIKLEAAGQVFTWWRAHAETGSDEHSSIH
jgi:hypothetical protein